MDAEPVFGVVAKVGEGIVFDGISRRLYWVDILGGKVHEGDPSTGGVTTWEAGQPVGCVAVREAGDLLLGLRDGLAVLEPSDGTLDWICNPEPDRPDNRFNDSACDPRGRFWAGTMRMGGPRAGDDAEGTLYRYVGGRTCRAVLPGFFIINGLAFAPDGRTMYVAETYVAASRIWSFDYDLDRGAISGKRVLLDTAALGIHPDGAAVDAEGCYWFCDCGGWRILRLDPRGKVDREIPLPVEKPTKLAFVGNALYVTSMSFGLTPGSEPRQPNAGRVLALDVGVGGPPHPRFVDFPEGTP